MRKNIINKTEDGNIVVKVAKELYERQAVFAAAHKLTDRFAVMIEPVDERTVGIFIKPKTLADLDEGAIEDALFDFCNDLLDEQVRIDLDKQFGAVRDVIVEQAFHPLTSADLSIKVKGIKNN